MIWVLAFLAAVVYFVPCWVAIIRRHRSQLAIGVLNIFLGWSVIGWILALVWACTSNVAPETPPAKTKRCPYCAENINADARRCKHCQADLADSVSRCECGRLLTKADRICPRCGVRVD